MGFLPDRSEVVLRHILERNSKKFPERECILFEDGQRWTYQEGLRKAYMASNILREQGIRRGENVLIFLPNGQDWVSAWWGVNFLGAVIVPVNLAYQGEMLSYICRNSQAAHIITTPDLSEKISALNLDLNVIDPASFSQGSEAEPKLDSPIEPWDIYCIVYTSGTTGPAKGVLTPYLRPYMIYRKNWCANATVDDTLLVVVPLFHSHGLDLVYTACIVGAKAALQSVFSASRYWEIVRATGSTYAAMIGPMPAILENVPFQPNDSDNPLKVLLSVPMVKDPEAFKSRFNIEELHTVYGMSETGSITKTRIDDNKKITSCGRVNEGYEIRIVDDHDIPVPLGRLGELIVRTDLPWELNAGYWNLPEETARAWRNGWFHTEEILRCDEDGYYYFLDRKKDAIRRRGENISSFEVEREVMAYPGIAEAACVGVPAQVGEDDVKIFVVLKQGAQLDPADLIRFLASRMPYFMVPRFVEVIKEFSKTATMRIKKYELRALGNSAATWDREVAGIKVNR